MEFPKADWDFSINLLPGDTNLDGIVDVIDIIYAINYILFNQNQNFDLFNRHKIDLNTDGEINILDITLMVSIILG